jgi:hypothetical protein
MPTTLTAKLKLTTTPHQFAALRATQLAYRDGLNLVSQYAFAHGKTSSRRRLQRDRGGRGPALSGHRGDHQRHPVLLWKGEPPANRSLCSIAEMTSADQLQPANPALTARFVTGEEWDLDWRVQGIVVAVFRRCAPRPPASSISDLIFCKTSEGQALRLRSIITTTPENRLRAQVA